MYNDPYKQFMHIDDPKEGAYSGDATYHKGRVVVWYQTPEAAQKAVELFNGVELGTYKEVLASEGKIAHYSGRVKLN